MITFIILGTILLTILTGVILFVGLGGATLALIFGDLIVFIMIIIAIIKLCKK